MLPLVVIVGPTAVGKSKAGVDLALLLDGEIISGDSMQVYRYMDIGTAKIKPAEMKGVPHHLIDIKDPDETFSVAEFQSLAEQKIKEIANKGRLPILVGGTGLYIQAVIDDYIFTEQSGMPECRKNSMLWQRTRETTPAPAIVLVDPAAAENIHVNDLKRTVRALEYYYLTRRPISENNKARERALSKYNAVLIGLTVERQKLYERIDRRVDKMMEEGLLEEVRFPPAEGMQEELPDHAGTGIQAIMGVS